MNLFNIFQIFKPTPQPRTKQDETGFGSFTALPSVPLDLPEIESEPKADDIDFDDLSRRFEALKKKK